jgi:cysteine desulfurase
MSKTNIYLDHNATTPVDTEVLESMLPYFSHHFGNAASKTHPFGWVAADAVNMARERVASLIEATPEEIVFTSGSTEGVNLAIKGVYEAYPAKGKHIITSAAEHRAVLDTCEALRQRGADITILPVNPDGSTDLTLLDNSIRKDTILVCLMAANNETGVLHDLNKISAITRNKETLFFCDATQAAGKIALSAINGPDLLCLSAHKMYGPKGIGALFIRRRKPRVKLIPQLHGGGHENDMRSGTLNVPGIVGFGKACEMAGTKWLNFTRQIGDLRNHFEQAMKEMSDVRINGSGQERIPNTSNITIPGIKAVDLIKKIPHIAISTGSACTSALAQPSHVLRAMSVSEKEAYESVRISLGKDSTLEEIVVLISSIKEII